MHNTRLSILARGCAIAAVVAVSACADQAPLQPRPRAAVGTATALRTIESDPAIIALRRASARYHELDNATDDGFVLLHACANEPGEGPTGTVYVNFERVLDGSIDPDKPDALIYAPSDTGPMRLVGVEFAVVDTGQAPPRFLGATFQREEEFGVFGLHVWLWLDNPEGLFAKFNPRITCGAE